MIILGLGFIVTAGLIVAAITVCRKISNKNKNNNK